jgi:large conductance mechanosensitive channel
MLKEFREFAMKGSVIDLGVAVIIGAAFGKIVTSLVENILMPPLGLVIGGVDFTQLKLVLKVAGADGKGEVAIGYGAFLQNTVNFLIVAWALFVLIKGVQRLKRGPGAPPAETTPEEILLLREIRDLHRARN